MAILEDEQKGACATSKEKERKKGPHYWFLTCEKACKFGSWGAGFSIVSIKKLASLLGHPADIEMCVRHVVVLSHPVDTVVCVLDSSPRPAPSPLPRRIDGLVKLNIFYKHRTLTVMVMHAKDLVSIITLSHSCHHSCALCSLILLMLLPCFI